LDELKEALIEGLYGKDTHIDPLQGLSHLSHDQALERTIKDTFSSYEILFHMLYWQEYVLKGLIATERFSGILDHEWPTQKDFETYTWEDLGKKFSEELLLVEEVINTYDIDAKFKTTLMKPILRMYLIILQHNSFHLGQISKNRMNQGTWPPTAEGSP
jgi:hypothetical protein